jgi:hypothetical protein
LVRHILCIIIDKEENQEAISTRSPARPDMKRIDTSPSDNIDKEGKILSLNFKVQNINFNFNLDPKRLSKIQSKMRKIPEMKASKEASPKRTTMKIGYDPHLDRCINNLFS